MAAWGGDLPVTGPQIPCFYRLFWKNRSWGDTDLWLAGSLLARGRSREPRVASGAARRGRRLPPPPSAEPVPAVPGPHRWVLGTSQVSHRPARLGFGAGRASASGAGLVSLPGLAETETFNPPEMFTAQ